MSVANVSHSSAAAASLLASARPGRALLIAGYNAKGSAQFIQLHDAAAVPGDAVSSVAEISTCDLASLTPAGLANKYFLISSPTVDYYVWFNLDAGGIDPAVAGRTAIAVAIATGNTAATMATAAAAAIDALAAFVSTATTTVITITNAVAAAATNIGAGNSGAAVEVTQQGVTAVAAAVPVAVVTVAASANFQIPVGELGIECQNGVVVCNSTAYATKVAGSADCFFTAVLL